MPQTSAIGKIKSKKFTHGNRIKKSYEWVSKTSLQKITTAKWIAIIILIIIISLLQLFFLFICFEENTSKHIKTSTKPWRKKLLHISNIECPIPWNLSPKSTNSQ